MNYQDFISYSTVSAVAFTLYLIFGGIYRLYLSPIAKFPGPKLAALTLWYEFYYDVICGGQYTFKIRRMHEKYGPIIRINPYELHIWTPEFYDEIYAGGGKRRDKWDWNARSFGVPESVLGTVEHDKHRIRRAALNPFFSAASVRRLQPMIEERLDKFMKRFEEFRDEGGPMNMSHAFAAYSNDVAMQYAFARSEHRIEAKDFEPSFHYATLVAGQMGHLTKQVPWLLPLMQSLPDWVTVKLYPDMASYVRVQQFAQRQVTNIQNGTSTEHQDVTHPTIFHEIINSKLPPEEKSFNRLWQDGQITVAAGTVTTAWALSVITYHLLKLPDVLRKLKEELATAIPDPSISIPVSTIEQLPYLTACINEGLRLSSGASTRLQRISPREPLHYTAPATASTPAKEFTIPAGTPMSMTNLLLHYNSDTFTSPNTFDPERYIRDPNLTKYLVPFSKGSRHCIGMNLAYAEIYIGLSRIFRVYGSSDVRMEGDLGVLELYETSDVDVEIIADGGIPLVAKESKGIRLKVLKV